MIDGPVRLGVCLVSVALLAGCVSSKPTTVVTVTRTPPTTPAGSSAATTGTPTTSAVTSPSPTFTHMTKLNGTCDTLLTDAAVYDAIGVAGLPGTDAFVVGEPDPGISRVAYLNCRYGVTGKGTAATPAIEIGISLYTTDAKAAARISATVDDYTAHGASAADATVKGVPATMLTGGVGDGYDVPLLVVAAGQRTVAVSVDSSVAKGAKAVTDATALAALALNRTGR
jgi:hypothetical protein